MDYSNEANNVSEREINCDACHFPECECDLKCNQCEWEETICRTLKNGIDDLTVSWAELSQKMGKLVKVREEHVKKMGKSLDYLTSMFKQK